MNKEPVILNRTYIGVDWEVELLSEMAIVVVKVSIKKNHKELGESLIGYIKGAYTDKRRALKHFECIDLTTGNKLKGCVRPNGTCVFQKRE